MQENINYYRVAQAIEYIKTNFKAQPRLEDIAESVHLSPFHFQKLFTEWAGTSPKKFLQYISVEYAKHILQHKQASLFDATYETGLSSTGRLHDLFIQIEGMTPAEYKHYGKNLIIQYSYWSNHFGKFLVASTTKGLCHLAFIEDEKEALDDLKSRFPSAEYQANLDEFQQNAVSIFNDDWSKLERVKLHLKGTDFQLKVWEALLKIPTGKLTTYGNIAQQINHPKASRAVGTAVGDNPVAFLIPCHRVIQSSGIIGEYRWGSTRKMAMIGWEAAKVNALEEG